MVNLSTLKNLVIPEGVVIKITDTLGNELWEPTEVVESDAIILEVEKIVSNTYANNTTYNNEEFIVLEVYPKTNGTVKITYGNFTKTITDISGEETPSSHTVFFGTFKGVTDEVATPTSGTLTIEGDYRGVGCGNFNSAKSTITDFKNILAITSLGKAIYIPPRAFYECTKIARVTIPDTVLHIGLSAFYGSGLTNVIIPNSVTRIDNYAFNNCSSLEGVVIGDSVTSIGDQAFAECKSLTSVVIGDSVTSIGKYAFRYCSSLTSITIPNSVTSIGNQAFYGCSNLVEAIFDTTEGWIAVPNGATSGTSLTLTDAIQNAIWLTDTYVGYDWHNY